MVCGSFKIDLWNLDINLIKKTLVNVQQFLNNVQVNPKSVKSVPFYSGLGPKFSANVDHISLI